MEIKQAGFNTKTIHAGAIADAHGALSAPIYQTSTFSFSSTEQGGRLFAGEEEGFIYSRLGNPTTAILQNRLAELEHAEAALVLGSGMGAISTAIWTACAAGDHIIADETLYGGTYAFLAHGISRYGVEVSFIDTQDLDVLRATLKPQTRLVYLETPANPNLKITDLATVSTVAHEYNPSILVMCDNTFATPYLQLPLELGCDIVAHSLTKYINGHGDVIAGAIVGSRDFIRQATEVGLKYMTGATISPFDSYLILRGLKTLSLRMDKHCASALAVAEFLQKHTAVRQVYYPGLPGHPGHQLVKQQMRGFGGVVSFELNGGRAAGAQLLNSLNMISLAVSLGDAETLIQHPASMTHSTYTLEELAAVHISEDLVRLSVGLEDVEDIIADLQQGLDKLTING